MALNQARNAWTAQFQRTAVQTTEVQNSFLFRSNPGFEDWRSQYILVALKDKCLRQTCRINTVFCHGDKCQVSRAHHTIDRLVSACEGVNNNTSTFVRIFFALQNLSTSVSACEYVKKHSWALVAMWNKTCQHAWAFVTTCMVSALWDL